jgi:hypothetical protein
MGLREQLNVLDIGLAGAYVEGALAPVIVSVARLQVKVNTALGENDGFVANIANSAPK